MDLFDSQVHSFCVGDLAQLRTGYDMRDPYSRCRVHTIESGSYFVAPWLVTTKKDITKAGRWITFADADDRYEKLEDEDEYA